jgi:hypothetical protein
VAATEVTAEPLVGTHLGRHVPPQFIPQEAAALQYLLAMVAQVVPSLVVELVQTLWSVVAELVRLLRMVILVGQLVGVRLEVAQVVVVYQGRA